MSKQKKIYFLAAIFLQLIFTLPNISAQTFEATIKIEDTSPSVVHIQGKNSDVGSTKNARNFSFAPSYAGIENLGERISQVVLFDDNERKINYKKLIAGEFLAESDFSRWSYRISAGIPINANAMAHISWLSSEQGILMLGDLFPIYETASSGGSAKITFELPQNWKIISNEKKLGEKTYEVKNIEKAVFFVGRNWREKEIFVDEEQNSAKLNFIISGERQFSDDEAFQMAGEVYSFYKMLFRAPPNDKTQIFLGKFPLDQKNGRWEAETRGANVVILSSEMPFKNQSLQRLHEQLRHEIFHLWMPNGLNLSGSYDWFYEGFALYQSLRAGVSVNRLRFEDFLDTLARAYTIDSLQNRKTSLIEASKTRWTGANTQIYARGMLVAFLCDAMIMTKSKSKNSLTDVFREIYEKHRLGNVRQDGNTAILAILERREELRPLIEKYVKNAEIIRWENELEAVGIESIEENFQTKLKVKAKLSGRQKDLLDGLGYNNWRKLRKIQNEKQ